MDPVGQNVHSQTCRSPRKVMASYQKMVLSLVRIPRILLMVPAFGLLGGCDAGLLNPHGDVALQQRDIIYASTALMLLIVVPVLITTVIFAWRYRASNTTAPYDP